MISIKLVFIRFKSKLECLTNIVFRYPQWGAVTCSTRAGLYSQMLNYAVQTL
jgi:hypothetical protein